MNKFLNKKLVIAGAGGGSSGGSDSPVEDDDTLQSRSKISILDLLGEGQIGGLVNGARSIFLDDTPLENSDGTLNFSGVTWDFRDGTQNQTPMSGFDGIETPHSLGTKVKAAMPVSATISNPNVDAVRLIATVGSLSKTDSDDGDTHGTSVQFRFDLSVNNLPYQEMSGVLTISGKTTSRYSKSYYYTLPKTDGNGNNATLWTIRMTRITPDAMSSYQQDTLYFDSYSEVINSRLSYPNSALVGMTIDSALFSSIPKRSYLVYGLYIRVPSNYDPNTRSYSGVWDGTFKLAVSSNPAWILFDLLMAKRYGLGQYLSESQIDKAKLYQIGRYCDEMVPDGFGGQEPRFAINVSISTLAEAYKLITDICSVFNSMSFWNGSMVGFMQDSPTDPTMIYSAANVVDGTFTYSGSSRKDRHSVILVTWNDPSQNYKQVVEYVEDAELVEKFGIRKYETIAFGCTSRGQAVRIGRWMLYTERYQSDLVEFTVGIDSATVEPGEIVKIHDTSRAGKRMAGRLVACSSTLATLDAPVSLTPGATATISIRMPDGSFVDRALSQTWGDEEATELEWVEPLPDIPVANAIWLVAEENLVPMLARVVAIAQGEDVDQFVISAVEHNPSKYDAIEKGWALEEPKTSVIDTKSVATPKNLKVTETPYEVAPGIMGLNLGVSWEGSGYSYNVSWRRTGKYETNWATERTTSPMLDLTNVRAGTYYFQVTANNALGYHSQVLTGEYITIAKCAAPGDVPNFKITKRTNDLLLTWDAVTDIALKGYEVRVGPSWDEGEVLTTNFNGTMITHDQDYAGTYHYHIRSINMQGEYSENVSTITLVLTAPVAVRNFDCIPSERRIELNWSPNSESDIVYYEIREGNSWQTGALVSQVKATTFTIPSGGIGTRKFWIKAVASPGIYSEVAAWVDTSIAMPTDTNILAMTDEFALGWPGNKLNMHIVGYDLMMDNGVGRSEYIFPVDLLDTYKASNSIYATFDSIVYDTDTMTWDTSLFDWDDPESERHWAPGGDVDSVVGRYQIAAKTGLRYGEIDGWRLNDSLTSVNSRAAVDAENVSYETGRYSNGLRLRGGVKASWSLTPTQTTFKHSMWIIPKLIGNSCEIAILEFGGSGGKHLRLSYDEPSRALVLTDHNHNKVTAPIEIAANDMVGVCVVQTETKRQLFASVMGGTPVMGEGNFAPVGAMDSIRLFWL